MLAWGLATRDHSAAPTVADGAKEP